MYKIKSKKNGFTLIEMMVVIMILGILLSLSLSSFDAAVSRARYASMKSNMHNLQVITESYSAAWGGIYPATRDQLFTDANLNKYWKFFNNPFSKNVDLTKDVCSVTGLSAISAGEVIFGSSGCTAVPAFLTGTFATPNTSTYVIYGVDKNQAILTEKSTKYYLSNN
jgi:prepilin-type N-terminal cleavage/methylation domain-containing protein